MLCNFGLGENATMDTLDDGMFSRDETDITMISYVIEAGNFAKPVVHLYYYRRRVCVHNLTNFCPYDLISTPNVP